MPEADPTNTPTLSGVVAGFLQLVAATGDGQLTISVRRSPAERELLLACQAVAVRSEAMRLLTRAVAEVSPHDPRHEASYAVVEQLRPEWGIQLARVSETQAQGCRGITAKARLFASLVGHDAAEDVDGPPALRLAASLVDDLLVLARS